MRWRIADVADRAAQDLGAPGGRINQLHQQLERRGLARAIGPEKPEDLAGLDFEREASSARYGRRRQKPTA